MQLVPMVEPEASEFAATSRCQRVTLSITFGILNPARRKRGERGERGVGGVGGLSKEFPQFPHTSPSLSVRGGGFIAFGASEFIFSKTSIAQEKRVQIP